jgi:hypothetical protein
VIRLHPRYKGTGVKRNNTLYALFNLRQKRIDYIFTSLDDTLVY